MAGGARPRKSASLVQTVLVCAAIGWATFAATTCFLDSDFVQDPGPGELVFAAEILEDPNPYDADLRAAAQVVRERWSYLEHRQELDGFDLEARLAGARERLGATPTDASFLRALTYLIAGLHDGHAAAIPGTPTVLGTQCWPLRLVEVAEGIMVDGVTEGLAGIARGDLLLEVDGRPIDAWIREREELVMASTAASRRQESLRHLCLWDEAAARRFLIRAPDGTETEHLLELPRATTKVPTPARLPQTREHRMLADRIGYFRPGNFSPPPDSGWPGPPEGRDAILADTYAEIDAHIGALREARALILDLRNNPGGTDLLGQFLVDRLVRGDYIYFRLAALGSKGWRQASSLGSWAPQGEHSLAGKPLVVLVDPDTFSTADNVAACLEAVHPDVRFVGRPNGAGTGAPRPFELPRTGATIYFCTQRVQNASGRMGEGISVRLDVPVTWTRADLLNGDDPDLAAARALLAD